MGVVAGVIALILIAIASVLYRRKMLEKRAMKGLEPRNTEPPAKTKSKTQETPNEGEFCTTSGLYEDNTGSNAMYQPQY